jgi:ribosomal protein S15P/S13E
MVMVSKAKTVKKDDGKDSVQDLVKEITDTLWSYDSVRRVVNNNYIILQAIVRNAVKSLGINADNFDFEAFNDNFDVHELDTQSQDTLVDSLAKVLSKFIIHNEYDKVDIAMEMAPVMIESRLREVMDYLKSNPNDNETIEYAKELIKQLQQFNWSLALRYERELESIVKPRVTEEPRAVVRVIDIKPEPKVDDNNVLKPVTESRLRQIRSYERLRPRLRELREETTRALEDLRRREIRDIEDTLRQIFELLKDPRESKYWSEYAETAERLIERLRKLDARKASEYETQLRAIINVASIEGLLKHYLLYVRAPTTGPYYVEKVRELIEKLRKVNPQKANEYERKLNTILYEKRKYANYGKKEPRAKVRIRHASVRITEYFNANETESDKRELVNDVNAVDVSEILRPRPSRPRSVKADVKSNTKITTKRNPGLLRQIRKIMDVIGKDFVNMYYYRGRY